MPLDLNQTCERDEFGYFYCRLKCGHTYRSKQGRNRYSIFSVHVPPYLDCKRKSVGTLSMHECWHCLYLNKLQRAISTVRVPVREFCIFTFTVFEAYTGFWVNADTAKVLFQQTSTHNVCIYLENVFQMSYVLLETDYFDDLQTLIVQTGAKAKEDQAKSKISILC